MSEAYINVPPSDKVIEGGTINIYQNGVTYFKDMVTEEELEARLSEINNSVDLTGYATEKYVDEKIGNVDLSPIQAQIDALKDSDILTYEKAVELGLSPEMSKEDYDATAQYLSDKLQNAYKDTVILYGAPLYTIDDFLYMTITELEDGVKTATKFNPILSLGQLSNNMIPQDYIDYINNVIAETGDYNGNFIEYLYYKSEKQQRLIEDLTKRIAALESK